MLYSRFFSPILARWSFATSPIRRKPSVTTVLLPTTRSYASSIESLPRVAQPSLWHSIVPRFLRKSRKSEKGVQSTKPKEWNPATFFIIIFMLIGSNAIQMIALRNDFTTFSRRADAKIGLLKEVIDRVQRGEEVDVERILGTNDKEKESEWEEVLREIEEEDRLWQSKARKKGDQILSSETYPEQPQHNVGDNMETTGPTSTVEPDAISAQNASDDIKKAKRPVGFY